MRVDDAANRAGSAVRASFENVPTPALRARPGRTPVFRALATALVVVFALTSVALLVRRNGRGAASAGFSSTWRRIRIRDAFGPGVDVEHVVSGPAGFVATGAVSNPSRFRFDPAVWVSRDGRTWVKAKHAFAAPMAVTSSRRSYLILDADGSGVRAWTSDDGLSWHAGPRIGDKHVAWKAFPLGRSWAAIGFLRTPCCVSAGGLYVLRRGTWERIREGPMTDWGNVPQARVRSQNLGIGPEPADALALQRAEGPPTAVLTSPGGLFWSRMPSDDVPDFLAASPGGLIVGVHYRPARGVVGDVALMSSSDGRHWVEAKEFRHQFPLAKPDALVASGTWWVLAGSEGSGAREAMAWATPDLVHWSRVPRALHVRPTSPGDIELAAHRATAVVMAPSDRVFWIWHRPAHAPRLVSVSGTARSVGGPNGETSIIRTVTFETSRGKLVDVVDVAPDGSYSADLPSGRYWLRAGCASARVVLSREAVRHDVVCRKK